MNAKNYSQLKNWVIITLVICNLVCVWFLMGKPTFMDQDQVSREEWFIDNILKKNIGLDDEQVVDFMKIKKEQQSIVHEKMGEMHELRKELFNNLGNKEFNLSEQVKKTGQLQSELDSMAFTNFNELRSICRPHQYEAFDQGVRHLMLRGGGRRGHNRNK